MPEAYAAMGYALSIAGRRAEAIAAFEQALALDPKCHEANRFYAEFCVTQAQFELAATYFMRAMEIKPTDYAAPVMLMNVFRSLGQNDQAKYYARVGIQKTEEELKLHPENANVSSLGATVLAFLGEKERAMAWLARALTIDPGDLNTQYNAACTYALMGEVDRAIDLLENWVTKIDAEMRLWFENDSDLDSIRSHPRYSSLVELSG